MKLFSFGIIVTFIFLVSSLSAFACPLHSNSNGDQPSDQKLALSY